MITLTLTECPIGLRGDLSKWLMEIDTGVFVGNVTARVRDELWIRIKETCKNGRAVLAYDTNNEQGIDFKIHGGAWEPIDFDGLKLMLRPSPARLKTQQEAMKHGFSNAARLQTAKKFAKNRSRYPGSYVVVDVETTGLNSDTDDLLEIGALKVSNHEKTETFSAIIKIGKEIPSNIINLTGITSQMANETGISLLEALNGFLSFLGSSPIVAHNADFDMGFLLQACAKCGIPLITNRCIDTLALSRKVVRGLSNYKLGTLAEHLGIEYANAHRSLGDCEITWLVYEKLMKILDGVGEN